MAAFMVTCGRGMDDFVRHEILKKIPGTVELRQLGEGKLAFRVCQTVDATREEQNVTSTSELTGTTKNMEHQESVTTRGAYSQVTPAEGEDAWITAISHIFKLKLVERVFTLLHCENMGPNNIVQAGVGNSSLDDILSEYESKINYLIECIKWNDLAVKLKGVRDHRNEENSRTVWCQDPDLCPGSLRRRKTRQELEQKRGASVSTRDIPENFIKYNRKKKNKVRYQNKKLKVHEANEISDSDLKPVIPKSISKYENAHVHGISGSNTSNNYDVGCSNQFTTLTDLNEKRQYSQIVSKEDPRNRCDRFEETTSTFKEEWVMATDNVSRRREIYVMPEERKSPQSMTLKVNQCPSPQKDLKSEIEKGSQNVNTNSTAPVFSTFRVSSRVSGPNKHILTVKWINQTLSQQLIKAMPGWVPDWRWPLVDLYVNITSSHYIVGAALSPRPLSLRPYIPHLTLRSTISHLMATLSRLPPEAVVLDPMCGGGSILVEAAMNFDISHVIASDISQEQLEVARCNLHNLKVPVTLLQADAQELPLQDSSVNTVLCDFPFGHKHKLPKESQQLLAEMLKEMHRVLVHGGRAVFLLSSKQKEDVSQLTRDRTKISSTGTFEGDCLILLERHCLSLGETSACVAVLVKEQISLDSSKEKRDASS